MKRILLLTFILSLFFSGFAQRPVASKEIRNFKAKMILPTAGQEEGVSQSGVLPFSSPAITTVDEDVVGKTFYDLQTNSAVANRVVVYDDGTIGAAFTFSGETAFTDRGTGYNYFDGADWGDYPTERIEDERTGWPAYDAWGENGEIVVSHYSGAPIDGLAVARRETKGEGDWTLTVHNSPQASAFYLWPKMVTGGTDNSVMHVIALTAPIANGGALYEGLNAALLYSRSEDGGDTWSINGELFPELNSDHYKNFGGDGYAMLAEGDNVAFVYGDGWTDFGMMKSTDGGNTWTQTIIWEHPYPLFSNQAPIATENFYNNDGTFDIAFDQSGMAHVVFGINRSNCDGTWPGSWFPGVGGIGYWNEDRPTFSADTNALCPYPDEQMIVPIQNLLKIIVSLAGNRMLMAMIQLIGLKLILHHFMSEHQVCLKSSLMT